MTLLTIGYTIPDHLIQSLVIGKNAAYLCDTLSSIRIGHCDCEALRRTGPTLLRVSQLRHLELEYCVSLGTTVISINKYGKFDLELQLPGIPGEVAEKVTKGVLDLVFPGQI